jgi:hypothetical protein
MVAFCTIVGNYERITNTVGYLFIPLFEHFVGQKQHFEGGFDAEKGPPSV